MYIQIHKKIKYDARKADVWNLGCVLFMMSLGMPLYRNCADEYFKNLISGHLKEMLYSWNVHHLVPKILFDLLNNIFKHEKNRFTITQILNHRYLINVKTYSDHKK